MVSPTPEQLRKARKDAGLTQTQAAELVYTPFRTYQDWEYGVSRMPPAVWELFLIKIA